MVIFFSAGNGLVWLDALKATNNNAKKKCFIVSDNNIYIEVQPKTAKYWALL